MQGKLRSEAEIVDSECIIKYTPTPLEVFVHDIALEFGYDLGKTVAHPSRCSLTMGEEPILYSRHVGLEGRGQFRSTIIDTTHPSFFEQAVLGNVRVSYGRTFSKGTLCGELRSETHMKSLQLQLDGKTFAIPVYESLPFGWKYDPQDVSHTLAGLDILVRNYSGLKQR
jgi:hypothetical protein